MPATGTRRRNFGYAATRERIIEAACEIMREEGVGALSLHELARRLGMKTPSLYTYFESKHALYDEIFRMGMRQYRRDLAALLRDDERGPGLLEAPIAHYLRFAAQHPELYSLLFERPVPGFVPSEASMAEANALLEETRARVQSLLDSGAIKSGLPAEQTRDIVLVVMHGLASLRHANEPGAPPGAGRFGSLVPHLAALLASAWIPANEGQPEREDRSGV